MTCESILEYSSNNNCGMTNDHTTVTHKKRDVSVCHKTQNLPIRCQHMLASHGCRQQSDDVFTIHQTAQKNKKTTVM